MQGWGEDRQRRIRDSTSASYCCLDLRKHLRGMKGCAGPEVGRASSLPVLGASCPNLESRNDRALRRGWKPLEPAGGASPPALRRRTFCSEKETRKTLRGGRRAG